MVGQGYSTKFAPWLARGCLSPRRVALECAKYEQQRVANKSTYWVKFELTWRDYFIYYAHKYGAKLFFPYGVKGSSRKWRVDSNALRAWKEGRTGAPLVDANMRELRATGFMSNPAWTSISVSGALGDDAAVLAPSSGEEPALPRHRASAASMAWRSTRRFRTNAP
jgi:hypothetical protein